jgi:hypothetical protein
MSPSPQLSVVTLRLTKKSPPLTGVGQKSADGPLIGAGKATGAPNGAFRLGRCATQMSSPPAPPGRSVAM